MDQMEKQDKREFIIRLGKHIKKVRIKMGLSGSELGRKSFIEKPNITRIEKGRINPSMYVIKKICDGLDITFEELFKGFK